MVSLFNVLAARQPAGRRQRFLVVADMHRLPDSGTSGCVAALQAGALVQTVVTVETAAAGLLLSGGAGAPLGAGARRLLSEYVSPYGGLRTTMLVNPGPGDCRPGARPHPPGGRRGGAPDGRGGGAGERA
jgi:hypothetical protein